MYLFNPINKMVGQMFSGNTKSQIDKTYFLSKYLSIFNEYRVYISGAY